MGFVGMRAQRYVVLHSESRHATHIDHHERLHVDRLDFVMRVKSERVFGSGTVPLTARAVIDFPQDRR